MILQHLAYSDVLERGSLLPKVDGDVRSGNELVSSQLEKEVALAMGENEEEANIR